MNLIRVPYILDELFIYLRTLYGSYGGFNQFHAINVWAVGLYNPEDIEVVWLILILNSTFTYLYNGLVKPNLL